MQVQLLRPLMWSPIHGCLGKLKCVSWIYCFTSLTENLIFINLRNGFKNAEAVFLEELSLLCLKLT